MCGGPDRNRERRKAEKEAKEAQKAADREAARQQAKVEAIAAERRRVTEQQAARAAGLQAEGNRLAAQQQSDAEKLRIGSVFAEEQIKQVAAQELEEDLGEIEADNTRRVNAIRTVGGAAGASLAALSEEENEKTKGPTAQRTKKGQRSGPRATVSSLQRGSASSRGTNLSI